MNFLLMIAVGLQDTSAPLRDLFGASVATLPDLDGGGQPDLAIGDPVCVASDGDRGRVWIVSMETGHAIRTIEPDRPHHGFGWTLCVPGDIDGRGVADLIVGAQRFEPVPHGLAEEGRVFAYALEDDALLRCRASYAWELVDAGYPFCATPCSTGVGDWNHDGCVDYAVASPLDTHDSAWGSIAIVSGKGGEVLHCWKGTEIGGMLGWTICSIPDVDGDGIPDLVASCPPTRDDSSGTSTATVNVLGSRERHELCVMRPEHPSRWFGSSLASAGDLDGDGRPDVWIGEPSPERGIDSATMPGLEAWSSHGWHRIARIVPKFADSADHRRFGSVLIGVANADGHGTPGVLLTEPATSIGTSCHVATTMGLVRSGVPLGYVTGASNVGLCATEVGDVDGDGVRDFALGGVSTRGHFTGVVVIWSRTRGRLREMTRVDVQRTLSSVQRDAK